MVTSAPLNVTEEQVAAAQLRLVLDEKLGRQTPEVVRQIAAMTGVVPAERKRTSPPTSPSITEVTTPLRSLSVPRQKDEAQPPVEELKATPPVTHQDPEAAPEADPLGGHREDAEQRLTLLIGKAGSRKSFHIDALAAPLAARVILASWPDPASDAATMEQLLIDQLRVLGPDHPEILLATRANLASWLGEIGDPASAAAALEQLLIDQLRVLGPDHPDILATRANLAFWRDKAEAQMRKP